MSKFCKGGDGTIGVEGGSMIGNEGSGDGSNQGGSEITRTNVSSDRESIRQNLL